MEKLSFLGLEGENRQEGRADYEERAKYGGPEFATSFDRKFLRTSLPLAFGDFLMGILDKDNDPVHDIANSEDNATHGHDVEADIQVIKGYQGDQNRERQRNGYDEGTSHMK